MPLSNLNLQQKEACQSPSGYNLVIASAGTGKTSTIVGRISFLLQNGILPSEILLLTFTNKAASEMLSRLSTRFPPQIIKGIEAGTFHAVAYRYLKAKNSVILKQPRELKMLFKSLYDKRVFLNAHDNAPYGANYLYDLFSLYFNTTTSESFTQWLERKNSQQLEYVEMYLDVWEEFQTLKQEHHYVDYNDLLLNYKASLLNSKTSLFKEILVDEYQDTNPLQDSILQALNPPSLFCVGDYDQSIYAFNGADINIIADFKNRYPQGKIYSLTKNYRSTEPILNLANRVIAKNPRIYPKELEVIKEHNFGNPALLVYEELFAQYAGIAQKIKLSNRPYTEIAVIFRNNSSADGIEASLREIGIPTKRKGSISFFDAKEVVYMLNLCTLLFNPKDMMAFIHTLSHAKGIGNAVAKDIYEALLLLGHGDLKQGILYPDKTIKNPFVKGPAQLGLFDDVLEFSSTAHFHTLPLEKGFQTHAVLNHPKLTKDGAEFLNALYCFFKFFNPHEKPSTLITKIQTLPLFHIVSQRLAKERSLTKDGTLSKEKYAQSLERIQRKMSLLRDLSMHYNDIGRFLNAMILGSSEMSEGDGVHLLSIHASKGLEFCEVYIVDLMEGRFPNKTLMQRGGNLEEERRLFYVAVTRAKENLYLSYAKKDMLKNIHYEGSIFLYEAGLLNPNSQ